MTNLPDTFEGSLDAGVLRLAQDSLYQLARTLTELDVL